MILPVKPSPVNSLPFSRSKPIFIAIFLFLAATFAHAGVIRGTVTDPSGRTVRGATIVLLNGKQYVSTTISTADGSFQFTTGKSGRFALVITADSFRQLASATFYAGASDSIERTLVMEPEYVHQSIVVTATGTPTPQQQTSEATTVLSSSGSGAALAIGQSTDFTSLLRIMPGTAATQIGQRGAQTSLFVRGGPSDANEIQLDGIRAGDLGGRFDFGPLSTFGVENAEVYRGTNSSLYGAGAGSGVVAFQTKRGIASFPTLRLAGDIGNFNTNQEQAELAGAHKKLDYLGGFSWFQTSNSLPKSQFHAATTTGNFGWEPLASVQIRGTVHYGVSATGVPNAWQFYQVADDATEQDQDLFLSGAVDYQMTADFHNSLRYGATRKREQYSLWQPSGQLIQYADDPVYGPSYAYYGKAFTLTGANGYTISGRAQLDYPETYPYHSDLVSNRDQFAYQGDYHFTPHLIGLVGFHYEEERGFGPSFLTFVSQTVSRTNYDYLAAVHGDFKGRFFYTLGGSLEHYSVFGTQTSPRAGLSFYAIKPRPGAFSGTRILFNFGDAVREPALTEQLASLDTALVLSGFPSAAQQLHLGPLAAPTTRTYEGGLQQDFLSDRLTFHASYFHNQFGKQIESVAARSLPELLPNLTTAQQAQLITDLGDYYTFDYSLDVNSEAYRAQGIETSLEGGIGSHFFLRGGYTYVDSVVQRSFSSDNAALTGGYAPTYNGIPIGVYSPLKGARPFRRPPHTGYVSASFAAKRFTLLSTTAFSSRSDDSTFLGYADLSGGNSLLLPNRNLDHGYAKIDFGGSYNLIRRLSIYGQAENLLSNQHIAPVGYLSLPFNFRAGLRLHLGGSTGESYQ